MMNERNECVPVFYAKPRAQTSRRVGERRLVLGKDMNRTLPPAQCCPSLSLRLNQRRSSLLLLGSFSRFVDFRGGGGAQIMFGGSILWFTVDVLTMIEIPLGFTY
jgi:hypothetical protein